ASHGAVTLAADEIAQGYATLAFLHQARNKQTLALTLMEELVGVAQTLQFASSWFTRVSACRARLALMQGHLVEAVRWAEASGLSAEDDLMYVHEWEYLILARVRIAQGRLDPAGPNLPE